MCEGLVITILSLTSSAEVKNSWQRSALIYFNDNRTEEQWRRHVIRADPSGKFTVEPLFDAAILTRAFLGQKDLTISVLDETELIRLLKDFISEAGKLDKAVGFLSELHKRSNNKKKASMEVIIGVPAFPNQNVDIILSGIKYRLSNPSERVEASKWFVRKIKSEADKAQWKNLVFYGTYYIREDALQEKDDVNYLQALNKETHKIGMSTVWVPYYDAYSAWNGKGLGFNVTVVQPRYAFLSSIDGGDLKGDRLYSCGYKAAGLNQNYEYEVRSQGESLVEYYMAHQYLAISQFTGASLHPQVFFVGGDPPGDIFDRITDRENTPGSIWATYEDLANYLRGDTIQNLEVGIPWNPISIQNDLLQIKWTVPDGYDNLNSVRLDFSDPQPKFANTSNTWRGRVSVILNTNSNSKANDNFIKTSFAQRVGTERINPNYNSVFVPVGNMKTVKGSQITIQVSRENGSPWPNVLRLVAAKYEPSVIVNPVYLEFPLSSRPNVPETYNDSKATHLGFGSGKLTDGKISPIRNWWWDGVMGWYWIEYPFSVTIDLGRVVSSISTVKIVAHIDPNAGVALPHRVGAMVSSTCQPQMRGILGTGGGTSLSCPPDASTGANLHIQGSDATGTNRNITLPFVRSVSGRYVTVSGISMAWCLIDEVEVIDDQEKVVSFGAKYRITPVTGRMTGGDGDGKQQPVYGDNSQRLLDGNVFSDWIFGSSGADGVLNVSQNKGGSVEATWISPKNASNGIIWVTNTKPGFGIKLPDYILMQWKNDKGQWQPEVKITTSNCGLSPCAKLGLPGGNALVTGIKGRFPPSNDWYMVTEISIE